jgi:DNA-binding MarR family transcriptional regulator
LAEAGTYMRDNFDLKRFFPYQVRIFYRAVSEAVNSVYSLKFGLSVSEWRTMAVLGPYNALSASEIVERSSMDKVNVSRAIKGLQAHGFLKRDIDGGDRRRAVLRLTDQGQKVLDILVPLVRQTEEDCLDGLSDEERATLISLMERVRMNAENQ